MPELPDLEPAPLPAPGDPARHAREDREAGSDVLAAQPAPLSAGPRPRVPLTGSADPAQLDAQAAASVDSMHSLRHQSAALVPASIAIPAATSMPVSGVKLPDIPAVDIELPSPPAARVPDELRDMLETGEAAGIAQDAPSDAGPQLPDLTAAADACLQETVHDELSAFREQATAHYEEMKRARAESEQRMHGELDQALQEQVAVQERATREIATREERLEQANEQAETRLQAFAHAHQTRAQASIEEITRTGEQAASDTLTRAEAEAARRRVHAEQRAAALLAQAEQPATPTQAVMRKPGASVQLQEPKDDDRTLRAPDLEAVRAEARRILEEEILGTTALLSTARDDASADVEQALSDLQAQIDTFEGQLESFANEVGAEMTLNQRLMLREIHAAITAAESELRQITHDANGNAITDRETLLANWDQHGQALQDNLTGIMDSIDAKAAILEPLYAYGQQNPGALGASTVEWTRIDTSFMENELGNNPGDLYFPYHTDARNLAGEQQYNSLFPWEGMAAVATAEHQMLHPFFQGQGTEEMTTFGDHWIPETMGIYQTMITRSDPESWGNFPIADIHNTRAENKIDDFYWDPAARPASPNAAAFMPGQYANPLHPGSANTFLADYGTTPQEFYDPNIATVHARGVAEDFYAIAAIMYLTGARVDFAYDSFEHHDTDEDLRGGEGNNSSLDPSTTDRAVFGNYREGSYQTLDTVVSDPRVVDGTFGHRYEWDVLPEDIGATPCVEESCRSRTVTGAAPYNGLKLRSGPGDSYPASTALGDGETVTVLYEQGIWAYIRVEGGGEGWVKRDFVPPG